MENKPKRQYVKKLRALHHSPYENPLLTSGFSIPVKRGRVFASTSSKPLIDAETGETVAASVICRFEEKDQEEFVKVFAAGVAATFSLTKTAQKVFQAVLTAYEKTPMASGYADSVYLAWFDGGLDGKSIGMSEATYNRGLWELLDKGFIAPRSPNLFWVNPALFFKGDRVRFVREYHRKPVLSAPASPVRIEKSPQLELDSMLTNVIEPWDGKEEPNEED